MKKIKISPKSPQITLKLQRQFLKNQKEAKAEGKLLELIIAVNSQAQTKINHCSRNKNNRKI
jgi:hypothetical protein